MRLGGSGVPSATCGSPRECLFDRFLTSHSSLAFTSTPCSRRLVVLQERRWKFSGPGPGKDRPHSLQACKGAPVLKDAKSIRYWEEQPECYYGHCLEPWH